jgi:hypothetical protein
MIICGEYFSWDSFAFILSFEANTAYEDFTFSRRFSANVDPVFWMMRLKFWLYYRRFGDPYYLRNVGNEANIKVQ